MTKLPLLSAFLAAIIFCSCSQNNASNSNQDAFANPSDKELVSDPDPLPESEEDETNTEMENSKLELGEIDNKLAEEGKKVFTSKCAACHAMDKKIIGPPMDGVTKRRTAEWILKMILDPADMLKSDPIAKKLLKEYNNIPMTPSDITDDEARAVLEYFRKSDS